MCWCTGQKTTADSKLLLKSRARDVRDCLQIILLTFKHHDDANFHPPPLPPLVLYLYCCMFHPDYIATCT